MVCSLPILLYKIKKVSEKAKTNDHQYIWLACLSHYSIVHILHSQYRLDKGTINVLPRGLELSTSIGAH